MPRHNRFIADSIRNTARAPHSQDTARPLRHYWYVFLPALILSGFPIVAVSHALLGLSVDGARTVSLAYRIGVLAYCCAIGFRFIEDRRIERTPFAILYVVFWSIYLTRLIHDTLTTPDNLGRPISEYYIFAFLVTLIPSVISFARLDNEEALYAGRIVWVFSVVAAVGVLMCYGVDADVRGGGDPRFQLETLNPISIGNLGLTLLIMSLLIPAYLTAPFRWWLGVGGAVLGFTLMGMAASRSAFIGFFIVSAAFGGASALRMARTRIVTLTDVLICANIVIVLFTSLILQLLESEYGFLGYKGLKQLGGEADISFSYRQSILDGAWQQFLSSPMLGSALEELTWRMYPHNIIVEAFMAIGILGGLLLIVLYVWALVDALRLIASRSAYSWIGALLLQIWVNSLFGGPIWKSDALFCLMTLARVSVALLKRSGVDFAGARAHRPRRRAMQLRSKRIG